MKKIIVIGGGPGGYVAALKGAILGAEVILIEKNRLGGTCLNAGCIPTKSFLMSVDMADYVHRAGEFGVACENVHLYYNNVKARKDAVVNQLVGGVQFLMHHRGVKVIEGIGRLMNSGEVQVTLPNGEVEHIKGDAVILAGGSVPIIPPMFGYDGVQVITSDEVLQLDTLPASILIVGGGVIGCEFGQFYQKMGVQVKIVELAEHLLPNEDEDVAQVISRRLQTEGVQIYTDVSVDKVEKDVSGVKAKLSTGEELRGECMLVSIGRKPNLEGLVAEDVELDLERCKIVVNDKMETSLPGVYAIGDLINSPMLAHVAEKEGTVAIHNILGREDHAVYHAVPRCVYTHPEIACVGITEATAKQKGIPYKKGAFKFAGLGKALVMGQTDGFVKVLVDENDRLIGASIVGSHATELLSELTMAIHLGLTAKQVGDVIHAHPTMSEALMEALHDVHQESVHTF